MRDRGNGTIFGSGWWCWWRPQCSAQPARTHDGSIWGCSNYVRRALLAADGRTGPQPRNAPRVTHMLPLPVSFHIGDDPPTGDVSLRPARPPSHELTSVRRQHGRADPVGTELPRLLSSSDLGSRRLITGVTANVIYLSSRSSRGRRRDDYRDHCGNGGTKCRQ